jgi:aminopeptidase N/puromycin-sensitive aminopeptidase
MTTASGGRLVASTGSFCSVQDRDEVKSFFATHPVPSSDRSLQHAIERIDGCAELRSSQEPNLKLWLAGLKK